MSAKQAIPTFYLYGEPHRMVADSFVHVEALDDRSRPSEWTIKPHAHAELCHIFLISTGGGTMRVDDQDLQFTAPCLLIVPATAVHGFSWFEESAGTVITMATRYIHDLTHHDGALGDVFAAPRALPLGKDAHAAVERLSIELMRELGWSAPGHRAAVDATILSFLVLALRHATLDARPSARPGRHAAIVARLRERIEQRFRLREGVADHALALGVSETALRVACSKVAGLSPAQMLDQRALLEARRSLLYSNLSVAEIAYSLGFSDPAYFSRFFNRQAGLPPSRFRETQGAPARQRQSISQ